MNVQIFENYGAMSAAAAQKIIEQLDKKPNSLLCLAAGNTPIGTFRALVQAHKKGEVDFSKCTFVGLDEWVGLDRNEEGSCFYTLQQELFKETGVRDDQIFFFDSLADDLEKECRGIEEIIEENGKLDLVLLGVGLNGHLGFNEPGVQFNLRTHVIELDETTKTVGQKYFSEETELTKGITLGVQTIMEADTVLLLADGEKKSSIIQKTVSSEVTNEIPSTVLQNHPNAICLLDKDAAQKLDSITQL